MGDFDLTADNDESSSIMVQTSSTKCDCPTLFKSEAWTTLSTTVNA